MYSIVYVLVDSVTQKYYRELIISIISLREHMKYIPVKVLVDKETYDFLKEIQGEAKYIWDNSEVVIVDVDRKLSPMERSRWIKTSVRNLIEGDFLFLDTDTVVCRSFDKIISEHDLAMVLESHVNVNQRTDPDNVKEEFERYKLPYKYFDRYYNSGVIWCKDTKTNREFYSKWNALWNETRKVDKAVDQPALNYLLSEMDIIHELDGRYNVQVTCGLNKFPIDLISDAYVIHYFNNESGYYKLCDSEFKKLPLDSDECKRLIENPRKAFSRFTVYPREYPGSVSEVPINSIQYQLLKRKYNKHRKWFERYDRALQFIFNFLKRYKIYSRIAKQKVFDESRR